MYIRLCLKVLPVKHGDQTFTFSVTDYNANFFTVKRMQSASQLICRPVQSVSDSARSPVHQLQQVRLSVCKVSTMFK